MKALTLSGLAVALSLAPWIAFSAQARPAPRVPDKSRPILASLEAAATDCFVETVLANPKATRLAQAGRWYEAAGVIGFLCRPEVDAMVRARDALLGPGSGSRHFRRVYARHLDQQLAARLQPLLERRAVASAEAPEAALAEVGGNPDGAEATVAH